jgi:hypothetical protein
MRKGSGDRGRLARTGRRPADQIERTEIAPNGCVTTRGSHRRYADGGDRDGRDPHFNYIVLVQTLLPRHVFVWYVASALPNLISFRVP